MQIFLSKPDRERYGLPDELLDVDLSVIYQDEAEELDEFGIDPDAGWVPFVQSNDVKVWRAVVWLAVRRAGVQVSLKDLKFNRRRVGWIPPDESPGKDDSDPASETSESPTPPGSSPDIPDSPSET